jgi:lysozyme
VDWGKVAASGISFACAKATEGLAYVDDTFAANWAGMRKAGLTRCAYHFARPAWSPTDQAKHFLNTVNQAGGYKSSKTLQLMLDLEKTDGKSAKYVWEWTQAFISELKALTGRPGIIYTGFYFWRDSVGNPSDNLDSPLWLAAYTRHPTVPAAWSSGWTFWQYGDNGASSPGGPASTVPGIAGNVDVDYFRYDEATLARFCFP